MDSQPSGNKELLSIETSDLLFVLKGDRYGESNDACFEIKSSSEETIDISHPKGLHLLEYTNYEIIIESKNNSKVEFYHDNIHIRNKVTPVTSRSKNLSGIINFKGEIGLTDFHVLVNGKEALMITLEVYPSKISYKKDYENILRDVNEEIYNLAYGFLGRTYLNSEINNMRNKDDSEFYSILNYVFKKLLRAIDTVLNNPYHALTKESRILKYQNMKSVTNETISSRAMRSIRKGLFSLKGRLQGELSPLS